ncbi:MAG: hypothetical protein HY089_02340, partial [Ignavibacteriales bacterium]|nr:hypothetical protein [Ignavibacteriales bacterium]
KTLQQVLQVLSSDAAKSYVAPIVSGFGSDLNGGWFHRAPTASIFGFDLEFGVVAMGTIFNDENKKFNSSGVFQFDSTQADFLISKMNDPNYNSLPPTQKEQARRDLINQIRGKDFSVAVAGPTVIGDERDSMKVRFQGGQFTINLPGGGTQTVNIPATSVTLPVTGLLGDKKILVKNMVPLATPQLTFGTIAGTQVTIRYLPEIEINSEMGKVKYFGFGIQHNPGVWFAGELPLDVSASYFTQKLEAGNVFEAKTTAFGVNASKRLGWGFLNLTPYVGYMLEKSTLTFTYDYMLDTQAGKIPQKIVFELEGENKSRLTLGLSIKVLVVNVNADYNIGKFNSFTAGVMIII